MDFATSSDSGADAHGAHYRRGSRKAQSTSTRKAAPRSGKRRRTSTADDANSTPSRRRRTHSRQPLYLSPSADNNGSRHPTARARPRKSSRTAQRSRGSGRHSTSDDETDGSSSTGDEDDDEKMEDEDDSDPSSDDEEVLNAIVTRHRTLNAPSLLSRSRYLALVIQDMTHILLPSCDAPPEGHTSTALLSSSSSSSLSFPSPPSASTLLAVQHAVSLRAFRRYCQAQLLYAHPDAAYLQHSEFTDCCVQLLAGHPQLSAMRPQPLPFASLSLSFFASSPSTFALSSPIARLLRRSLGRPRRFSAAFIAEERAKLDEYRTWVRVQQRHQQSLQPPSFLPDALANNAAVKHRLIQGQEVIAVHPHTGEMHEGVVVGYGQNRAELLSNSLFHCYRVKYRCTEMGSALVEDVHVMAVNRGGAHVSDDGELPSVDTLVGAATRSFAGRRRQFPHLLSPMPSPAPPSLSGSSTSSPRESHLIATVLRLLDRKNLLVNHLESMNHAFRQMAALLPPTSAALVSPPPPPDDAAEPSTSLFSGFVQSYAWAVIQLEKTSQSLEGALMHYRLHIAQQPQQQQSTSPVLDPFLTTPPPPLRDSHSALHSVLTSAKTSLMSALEGLERDGRVRHSWWERRVQGGALEELMLLCVGLMLAMQRGEVQTVRELMGLMRRKAEVMRRLEPDPSEQQHWQTTLDTVLTTLVDLLQSNLVP